MNTNFHEWPTNYSWIIIYGTLHGSLHVYYMWRRRQESFFAFGEHEWPWMNHELLMNIIIWNITWVITCGLHVASQTRFFCLRRTRITVNEPRITHELLFMANSCLICDNSCSVADKNSFAWYWKELERIRKNSVQELEKKLFVIVGCHSFSFFVILFFPTINLKQMRVMRVIATINFHNILCPLRDKLCVLR